MTFQRNVILNKGVFLKRYDLKSTCKHFKSIYYYDIAPYCRVFLISQRGVHICSLFQLVNSTI